MEPLSSMAPNRFAGERRFLADDMLGRLARWLRAAGEDVATVASRPRPPAAGGASQQLLERARAAGRVVLTRDRRFPGGAVDRLIILSPDLDEQLLEFYAAFPADPLARPWTRCTLCNSTTSPVARAELWAELPPGVRAHGRDFRRCASCGHVFWAGTHTRRIEQRLLGVRERLAREPRRRRDSSPDLVALGWDHFDDVLRGLFGQHGYSWQGYRKVRRRLREPLARRLRTLGIADFATYQHRLRGDETERRRLHSLLAVSVSRFFRDRQDWQVLAERTFPALVARRRGAPVQVLVLGCASGEEPYSLLIAWREHFAPMDVAPPISILAADIRTDLLARAREAVYQRSSVHSVPARWLDRYFEASPEGFALDRSIVSAVQFVQLDFYTGWLPGPVDLVLCRNSAFTYLSDDRRGEVLGRVTEALDPGGFLMVGCNEGSAELPGFVRVSRCIFQRETG